MHYTDVFFLQVWFLNAAPLAPAETLAASRCLTAAARHRALSALPHPLPWPTSAQTWRDLVGAGGRGDGWGWEVLGVRGGGDGGRGVVTVGYVSSHFTKTMLNGLFNEVLARHDGALMRIVSHRIGVILH
jgi:hypothetical protein